MAVRSYVKATIDEVIHLYHKGFNFSQIARELGCCRNTVRRRISEYMAKTGSHIYISGKPHKDGYCVYTLCNMYKDGASVAEIATSSGLSKSYIYKVLKDYTHADR
jgi:DNA invertase Pin-like site-specific DNA recombinase